jgi:uncharacterized membrane protein YfhO
VTLSIPITLVNALASVPPLPIACKIVPAPHEVTTMPAVNSKLNTMIFVVILFIILFVDDFTCKSTIKNRKSQLFVSFFWFFVRFTLTLQTE